MDEFQEAMSLAIAGQKTERLKALLEIRDSCGETPLHYLAVERNAASVALLLDLGANPNSQDDFGLTILSSAVLVGDNLEVVEALLNAGADPFIRDSTRSSIIDQLLLLGRNQEADFLKEWCQKAARKTKHQKA